MLYSKQEATEKLTTVLAACSDVRGFVDTTYGRDATLWGRVTVHEVMAKNVVNMMVKQQLIIERLQAENDALKAAIAPKALYIEMEEMPEHVLKAFAEAMDAAAGNFGSIFATPFFSENDIPRHADANVPWRKIEDQP